MESNPMVVFDPAAMLLTTLPLLPGIIMNGVAIVALVYLIKALKIYIKNNK